MAEKRKIKGRISIDADDEGLMAILHFVPDEDGIAYDTPAVNQLILENGIVYGINREALDAGLQMLFAAPKETNLTVAEGDPYEKPVPEEREWTEIAIPEEHRDDVETVLKNAPPPAIYRTEVDKVKQEKIVKKKGLLSFRKEKEEKTVEFAKKESKIRVDVSPEVVEAGWIEAGDVIAEVSPAVPGKPGKSVYGKLIQPPPDKAEFYTGRGVGSKGGKLLADTEGILRRGINWVEIMDFKTHNWSLELSKDKNTCLLNFNPGGSESTPPETSEIIEQAEMLGCPPDTLLPEARIEEIINTAVKTGKILEKAILSTDEDGFFEIRVSEDKLKAELVMHKGRGSGKALVLKETGAAIKKSGLKDLNLKEIQERILEFYRGSDTDIVLTLAEGTAPEEGSDGGIVYELEFLNEKNTEEIKRRAAGLDEQYLSKIESAEEYPPADAEAVAPVKADQQIAAQPADESKKGVDVYGKEITPGGGADSAVKTLENVKLEGGKYASTAGGLLERFEQDGVTALRVRPHADSTIEAVPAKDKMTAVLSVFPAVGTGRPPSLEEANRLIEEAGIKKGIDPESVRRAVEKGRDGEEVAGAVIAMGKPPKNAGEYKLKFLIDLAGGEAVTIDKSGRANYRNQNKISSVNEGDLLAEIRVVQGESEDGWDVFGNNMPAKQLTPLNVEIGKNIKEEKDEAGDTFLIAEKSGRVVYENNKIEVQENLFIKGDVDFSTGNIKFGGDVNVKGNVKSGFYVVSGGSIAVGMNAETSLLTAEKSIAVAQGVKGGGKAVLRAKESIQLSFAERARLLAVEDITVKNAVFNCRVKCNGKLRLVTDKGHLVGGIIQARRGLEAANVGSAAGARIEISFGQDYLIADQVEIEEKEVNKIKSRLVKIDPEMRLLEKSGENSGLVKLRAEKIKLMKILEKRTMRIFTLKERFEQHYPGDVLVRGEVFPGVVFESHGRVLEIKNKEKAVKIIFNQKNGNIEKVPLKEKKDEDKE